MVALARALLTAPWLAPLLLIEPWGRSWTLQERATALASGIAQLGAGHRDAASLVSAVLDKYPGVASITPPGFDAAPFLPPIMLAAAAGNEELSAVLLGAGADPNPRNAGGSTPLMAAAEGGHAPVVDLLVSRFYRQAGGASSVPPLLEINARDARGMTALHLAALRDRGAVISTLVKSGLADPWARVAAAATRAALADEEWRGYAGYTPFDLAVAQGSISAGEALLGEIGPAAIGRAALTAAATTTRPAPSSPTDGEEGSSLHIAIEHGQQQSLVWLLRKLEEADLATGALSGRDKQTGATPLIAAVKSRRVPMVEALLKAGASTEEQDWNGWGPLHHATARAAEDAGDKEAAAIVHVLLMAGASPLQRIAELLPDSSPACASSGDEKEEEGLLAVPLAREGWTAQALAVAAGRMGLFATLLEGSSVAADVALDAWAALAATSVRDEGLRLAALDYVMRGAVRHAAVVRVLLRGALSTVPLGDTSTLFPGEEGQEPSTTVTALDVASFEGQVDAVHALQPPTPTADPRSSLRSRRQSLDLAVRGGHPGVLRLLLQGRAGAMLSALGAERNQKLVCDLRELAETALEAASSRPEAGGICAYRRRVARRLEVVAVLEEALPCEEEVDVLAEQQQQELELELAEENKAAEEDEEQQQWQEEEEEEEEAEEATCNNVCGPHLSTLSATALLECVKTVPPARLFMFIVFSLLLWSLMLSLFKALLRRWRRRRITQATSAKEEGEAAAESAQEGSLLERASLSLASEEALSTPTSEEQPPPSTSHVEAPVTPGKGGTGEVDKWEEEEEEEEEQEEEENHRLAAFTMGTLMRGSCRLPPEESRRLLAGMGASPLSNALRRPSSSPLSATAISDEEAQPKATTSAVLKGGEEEAVAAAAAATEAGAMHEPGQEEGGSGAGEEEMPMGGPSFVVEEGGMGQSVGAPLPEAEKKEKDEGAHDDAQEHKC